MFCIILSSKNYIIDNVTQPPQKEREESGKQNRDFENARICAFKESWKINTTCLRFDAEKNTMFCVCCIKNATSVLLRSAPFVVGNNKFQKAPESNTDVTEAGQSMTALKGYCLRGYFAWFTADLSGKVDVYCSANLNQSYPYPIFPK